MCFVLINPNEVVQSRKDFIMKNTFKKISILASALFMAVTSCFTAVTAGAESIKDVDVSGGYACETINLSDAVAIAGNCLMVQLSLNTGDQCTGYNLDIEFDSCLTLKEVRGAMAYCVIDNVVTIVNFTGTYFPDDENLTTLIFEAPEDAEEGAVYDIGVKNVENLVGANNEEIEDVDVKNSTVEVIESTKEVTNHIVYVKPNSVDVELRGDVNGDKNVDLCDAIKIIKYIMNMTNLTEKQLYFADVDQNGAVNICDAIAVCKYGMTEDKSTAWERILG